MISRCSKALNRKLLEAEDAAPGTILDHDFSNQHTDDFWEFAAHVRDLSWDEVRAATGLDMAEIDELALRVPCAVTATCKVTGRWESGRSRLPHGWTRCVTSLGLTRRAGTALTSYTRSRRCDGRVKVFVCLGGNFAAATPDTGATIAALHKCRLSVQVSTKLNRSHAVWGDRAHPSHAGAYRGR